MATKSNSMFRISQLAKDLGLKTKELTEKLNELGVSTKNTSASLEPDEVNLLFESLSKVSEIKDIDGYLRGKTVITLPESPEESATRLKQEKAEAEAKAKAEAEAKAKAEAEAEAKAKAEAEAKAKAEAEA